jgi:Diacylglycerol acyltransferase
MWLICAFLALIATLTLALVFHDFLIIFSAIVLYILYIRYVDDGPVSGYRTNYALRRLRAWSWPRINPLKLVMPAGLTFSGPETAQYIFVVLPNHTNSALFWTFGVYGGHGWRAVANSLRICYVMPAVLFYVPLLRELLLATGAVADSEAVLRHQISLGRNVAYAPHGMADVLQGPGQVHVPPMDLFEMVARTTSIYIVPVVVRHVHMLPLQTR